jgi:hypothetical protein
VGLVIPELVKRVAKVRGLIHDSSKEDLVRQHGTAEVAVGDLGDRARSCPSWWTLRLGCQLLSIKSFKVSSSSAKAQDHTYTQTG